jgi:hypothetical protein
MIALYLGTRTRTFISILLPKISSPVSEKRKTASFTKCSFSSILATKLSVKVHVYPCDSGRHQLSKEVSKETIRNAGWERTRKDSGPAKPSRISFCAAAYRPIVFKPPIFNSAHILQAHGHDWFQK